MTKREKKKDKLGEDEYNIIWNKISPDLEVYDLDDWQKACVSFAPIHYETQTRKSWFASNKYRLAAAREIVDFIDSWVKNLRNVERFDTFTMAAIKDGLIDAVRQAQEAKDIQLGRLNGVKLSGFKSLLKWADSKSELENGPYEGATVIPPGASRKKRVSKKSRKKLKGNFGPPEVDLLADYKIEKKNQIVLTITVSNSFMHPLQNVQLEVDYDTNLSIMEVKPFGWSPRFNRIPIGFVPASLDEDAEMISIEIHFIVKKHLKKYRISGVIFYDDCVKGKKTKHQLESVTIEV
ncbi:MAG: hypothetical protein ACTSQZ_06355 [Candidatus Thorarchaeota archaeon]